MAITECGSCTFVDAPKRGGMGWYVVDYSKPLPEVKPGVVRSEATQARYFAEVLEVFGSMDLHSTMIYQFVSPDSPHRPDRRYDMDIASYGLVKAIWERPDLPGDWHWERKQAFHTVA
ncbi:hypothetical protein [Nocardioides speluncae]|uniref:hypothetical protein n=1 Tax=Nocardioides speluncae TaxID=2670337 RepID=UPI001980913D|nr:hypothetical protein [Nocardioides speluncae]